MIKIIHYCEEYVHNPQLGHGEHKLVEYRVEVTEETLISMISISIWQDGRWWFEDGGGSFRVM